MICGINVNLSSLQVTISGFKAILEWLATKESIHSLIDALQHWSDGAEGSISNADRHEWLAAALRVATAIVSVDTFPIASFDDRAISIRVCVGPMPKPTMDLLRFEAALGEAFWYLG